METGPTIVNIQSFFFKELIFDQNLFWVIQPAAVAHVRAGHRVGNYLWLLSETETD